MSKITFKEMRKFDVIFNKLVISLTDADISMIGGDYPIIDYLGCKWAEFTVWANQALAPNIQVSYSYMSEDGEYACAVLNEDSPWMSRSHSTIKSHFDDYILSSWEDYDESGHSFGVRLLLKIPIKNKTAYDLLR